MRLLIITRIFPNRHVPHYAAYNRQLYGALTRHCDVDVWALLASYPFQGLARRESTPDLPESDVIDGMNVWHPRVLYAPKLGRPFSGPLYTASLAPRFAFQRDRWDMVIGSFGYPDGWAAVAIGGLLGIPAIVQVLGSDVNVFGKDRLLKPSLQWAFRRAAAVVGPSQQLIDKSIALGAPAATSRMVPNGVNPELFHVQDRRACREALGEGDDPRRWILFVGRVERAKGLWELMDAFEEVHRRRGGDTRLVLVGSGKGEAEARRRAEARDLPVLFAGERSDVATWYGACDLFTLPSWREGTPNVVLEALASGRRVVASNVGGIPDVVNDPALGRLVPPATVEPLIEALLATLDEPSDPEEVVARARLGTWNESADILWDVIQQSG